MDKRAKRHLVAGCLRAAAGSGLTEAQVAERCGVSRRTVQRVKAKIRRGDSLEDAPRSGRPRSVRTAENVAAVSAAQSKKIRRRQRKDQQTGLRRAPGQACHPVGQGDLPGGQRRVSTGRSARSQRRRRPSQAHGRGARRARSLLAEGDVAASVARPQPSYSVWSVLQDEVQATSHPNLESLKACIVAAWEALEAAYIVKTCKGFRNRVEAVIAADGGYIE